MNSKEVKSIIKYKKRKMKKFACDKLNQSGLKRFGKRNVYSLGYNSIKELYDNVFSTTLEDDYSIFISKLTIIKNNEKVYFIGNRKLEIVKIGFTTNIENRLKTIKTYCPFAVELFLLERGNIQSEQNYHIKFADYNEHNEWFRIKGSLEYHLFHQI